MLETLYRIGCVPYLNGKPLIDWFHTSECNFPSEVSYAVPSRLAEQLENGELDVALLSSFEALKHPEFRIAPDVSVAACGEVQSVRVFCRKPVEQVKSVALDTSSLTSAALTRIVMDEIYHQEPHYVPRPPDLDAMLAHFDAALIIGDLKLFETPVSEIIDLGDAWFRLTERPFVYAVWLVRPEAATDLLFQALLEAKNWGLSHLADLSSRWSKEMQLPNDRCRYYFEKVMRYGLGPEEIGGLNLFREKCVRHDLLTTKTAVELAPMD